MADAMDAAQELEERERQALIARARRQAGATAPAATPRAAWGFLDDVLAETAPGKRHVAH